MQTNSDFEEILLAFNAEGVRYLVVGAYAVAAYARPRATGDIDLWVDVDAENAARVYRALARFGAPMDELDEQTFCEPNIIFQIGIAPVRIDILTAIDGVTFVEAWGSRLRSQIGNVPVDMIGRRALLKNKRSSGRPKDIADLELLERHDP